MIRKYHLNLKAMEDKDKLYRSFLIKFVNSIVGTRGEFLLSLLLSIVFGILYSFEIWDKVAILFIFGMVLPVLYISATYQLLKNSKLTNNDKTVFKWFKRSTTNIFLMVIDVILTVSLGLLVYFEILDFMIVKILITIMFPFFYLNALHVLINEDSYIKEDKE